MPLEKSNSDAAFKSNVSEMVKAGHPQDQALAAAYRIKREKRAMGGPGAFNIQPKQEVRNDARMMTHQGPISSIVGGRTDHHPMAVKAGSYVLPADHVSALGQGNTANGMAVLNHMFSSGPFGSTAPKIAHGAGAPSLMKAPKALLASGGSDEGGARGDHSGQPVPIYAAGGEYVIPPEVILRMYGSLKHGHAILDAWVKKNREKHIKTLQKLPPPAKK